MFIYDKTGINIGVFFSMYIVVNAQGFFCCCCCFLHDKEGYSREVAVLDYIKKK